MEVKPRNLRTWRTCAVGRPRRPHSFARNRASRSPPLHFIALGRLFCRGITSDRFVFAEFVSLGQQWPSQKCARPTPLPAIRAAAMTSVDELFKVSCRYPSRENITDIFDSLPPGAPSASLSPSRTPVRPSYPPNACRSYANEIPKMSSIRRQSSIPMAT